MKPWRLSIIYRLKTATTSRETAALKMIVWYCTYFLGKDFFPWVEKMKAFNPHHLLWDRPTTSALSKDGHLNRPNMYLSIITIIIFEHYCVSQPQLTKHVIIHHHHCTSSSLCSVYRVPQKMWLSEQLVWLVNYRQKIIFSILTHARWEK